LNRGVRTLNPGYRTATIGLRSPRVAVLFPAQENWRQWARLALRECTRVWGGGGYALVPFDDTGCIHPTLIEAVQAYDPDHVELLVAAPKIWAQNSPEFIARLRAQSNDRATFDEWTMSDHGTVQDRAGSHAVDTLLQACSVMRINTSEQWESGRGRNRTVQPDSVVAEDDSVCIRAECTWPGDATLFVGARVGIIDSDSRNTPPPEDDLLAWCLSPTGPAPGMLVHGAATEQNGQLPTAFEINSPTLQQMRRGLPRDLSALIVVGDTAEDFALAVVAQRMRGFSIWLTPEQITSSFARSPILRISLGTLIQHFGGARVVSVSLDDSTLSNLIANFDDPAVQIWADDQPIDSRISTRLGRQLPEWADAPQTLMLPEHIGTTVALPVNEERGGTFELATRLDSPIPSTPPLSNIRPAWIVDIDFGVGTLPGGRALPTKALLAASNDQAVSIRASRDGIVSFDSASQGIVLTAAVPAARIARPTLRIPSLEDWVDAMAGARGLSARVSAAGQKTALMARRLGGRNRLTDIVSGPLHGVLREFLPASTRSETTTTAFPNKDGVVLSGNLRLLTYRAIERLTPNLDDTQRQDHLDELLAAEVMRRGLVLDCTDCHEPSFLAIDQLRQNYDCPRCGATNTLSAARWKRSSNEPEWYYDLHAAFRDLLRSDGDAVLLTAAHLRSATALYADTSELEFAALGAAQAVFEIDLIAHTRDGLFVCEVKSNASLGASRTRTSMIRKRFEAAQILRADKVVFASVDSAWSAASMEAVGTVQRTDFPAIAYELLSVARPK